MTIGGCLVLESSRVKALGVLKKKNMKKKNKKEEEKEDDEIRFSPRSGFQFIYRFGQLECHCRVGARLDSRSKQL